MVDEQLLENSLLLDSIEIGTPGKGGAIKVHGNFSNPSAFEAKIREAVRLRKLAFNLMEESK